MVTILPMWSAICESCLFIQNKHNGKIEDPHRSAKVGGFTVCLGYNVLQHSINSPLLSLVFDLTSNKYIYLKKF